MKRRLFWLLVATVCVPLGARAAPVAAPQAAGIVVSLIGPNLTLDDGTLIRLSSGTRIVRPDGSAGTRDDISRQGQVLVTYAADGSVAEVRAFPPRSTPEIYLSNLAPLRGSAVVTAARAGDDLLAHSLALFRTTYPRQGNWTQFRTEVRYEPHGQPGAPGAARFALKDSFGDLIVERVVSAGETKRLYAGLDAQATDRLTLEVTAAGQGALQQDWCLWLDPRFVFDPGPTPGTVLSPRTVERLADTLAKSLGQTKIERLALSDFAAVRVPSDQFFPRELSDQLFTLLGRKFRMAGILRRPLEVGAPLTDNDRAELGRLGAAFVTTGSVSGRPDGTVVNAVVVRVDNGAFVGAASVRE